MRSGAVALIYALILSAPPSVSAVNSTEDIREWCSELLVLRAYADLESDGQRIALKGQADYILGMGHPEADRLALRTLAEFDLMSPEMGRDEALARIHLNLQPYLQNPGELNELAAVVALRTFDQTHWSRLRTVEQLRTLGYLDRQKALADFREIFKRERWTSATKIRSLRRVATRAWRVKGEFDVADRLPFSVGGRPVQLVRDLDEDQLAQCCLVRLSGKSLRPLSEAVSFADLTASDIARGFVLRARFEAVLSVEDPLAAETELNLRLLLGLQPAQYFDLTKHFSRGVVKQRPPRAFKYHPTVPRGWGRN